MRQVKYLAIAALVCGLLLAVLAVGCVQPSVPSGAPGTGLRDMRITAVTDSAGNSTDTGEGSITGQLYALEWIDGDCANGVDITVTLTSRSSGIDLQLFQKDNVNDDAIYYPRTQVHNTSGTALTLEGSEIAYDYIAVNGIPEITVGAGGATKTCECLLYYYP